MNPGWDCRVPTSATRPGGRFTAKVQFNYLKFRNFVNHPRPRRALVLCVSVALREKKPAPVARLISLVNFVSFVV